MAHERATELLETNELYKNPVIELYPDDCQALFEAMVSLARAGQTLEAGAVFKTALGLAFKAGREDKRLDIFRG